MSKKKKISESSENSEIVEIKFPSEELLNDLKEVFEKHKWSGDAIGIRMHKIDSSAFKVLGATDNINATSITTSTIGGCQPPKQWKEITIHLANGTLVTKTVCL